MGPRNHDRLHFYLAQTSTGGHSVLSRNLYYSLFTPDRAARAVLFTHFSVVESFALSDGTGSHQCPARLCFLLLYALALLAVYSGLRGTLYRRSVLADVLRHRHHPAQSLGDPLKMNDLTGEEYFPNDTFHTQWFLFWIIAVVSRRASMAEFFQADACDRSAARGHLRRL